MLILLTVQAADTDDASCIEGCLWTALQTGSCLDPFSCGGDTCTGLGRQVAAAANCDSDCRCGGDDLEGAGLPTPPDFTQPGDGVLPGTGAGKRIEAGPRK